MSKAPHGGILKRCYEVQCRGCGEDALGLGFALAAALKTLADLGWKRRYKRWHCRDCIAERQSS